MQDKGPSLDSPSLPMQNNTLCVIVEADLEVFLGDLGNNSVRDKADLRVLWFGDYWVFRLYQCAFGRKDDSSPLGING